MYIRTVLDLCNVKKTKYIAGMAATTVLCMLFVTGCSNRYVKSVAADVINSDFSAIDERQLSLESRDYVITLTVDELGYPESMYRFSFEMADLAEYKGDSGNSLKTSVYTCDANSLDEAIAIYFNENERQPDFGHMSDILINNSDEDVKSNQLILEMSCLPSIAKSVVTSIVSGQHTEKLILREVIKNVYAGEDF